MQERRSPIAGLGRRELLRRGLVTAGAVALGPHLLRGLDGVAVPSDELAGPAGLRPIGAVVPSAPPIITRAQWGADESLRSSTRSFAPMIKAVVHHTAIDENDPAAQVRGIYRSHVQSNGWEDIGYNYLIDREGRIYEGRWARDYAPGEVHTAEDLTGNVVQGAHAEGHNSGSLGVALLGVYSNPSVTITGPAFDSLVRVLAWKFGGHRLDPNGASPYQHSDGTVETYANLAGHRDVPGNPTSCPGDGLHKQLPQIRAAVTAALSSGLVGYRILGADGSLWNYGADPGFGSGADVGDVRRNVRAGVPVRSAVGTPTGLGVWVTDPSGSVYTFGDAPFAGSLGATRLNRPIVGMAPTPSGRGYWLVASDGGIFCFGDALFYGSTGAMRLNQPIVGMAPTPTGQGYWLVASDGGIFCFGDARFFGSTGATRLNQPIFGMAATPDGAGYWLVARDGGVFTFGTAGFLGSAVGRAGFTDPAAALAATPSGAGYWILDSAGAVHGFGDAPVFGGGVTAGSRPALALVPVVRP
jgi:hypothetical protein